MKYFHFYFYFYENILTSLKSLSNPIFLFETSFEIIQSQFFSFNFLIEFSSKLFVSAENPTTIFGLNLLCFEIKLKISFVFSNSKLSNFSFLILNISVLLNLKSATAAEK